MIEVLVSLIISSSILLAIYQYFDTSHPHVRQQEQSPDVQQQARLAMEEIVERIRIAGYFPEKLTSHTLHTGAR